MLPLALLLAVLSGTTQDAHVRRIEARDQELRITLGADAELRYQLNPFVRRGATLAGRALLSDSPAAEYQLDDADARVEVVATRVVGPRVELDLRIAGDVIRTNVREVIERVALHDGVGYVRRVSATRPRRSGVGPADFDTATIALQGTLLGRPALRESVRNLSGYSTVSDAGVTYSVDSAGLPDGTRAYCLRMGYDDMTQFMNSLVKAEHTEVVLIAPAGARLAPVDLVLEFLRQRYDRRYLVRKLSRERYRALYEVPQVRHLDPARGRLAGAGTESDPWPSLERSVAAGQLWVLLPGSRLVLHDDPHGALLHVVSGLTVEAAPGARPVLHSIVVHDAQDVTLRGLVVQVRREGNYDAPLVSVGGEFRAATRVVLDGLEVVGTAATAGIGDERSPRRARIGIYVDRWAQEVTVREVRVMNTWTGMLLRGARMNCQGNVVEQYTARGIDVRGRNALVSDNIVVGDLARALVFSDDEGSPHKVPVGAVFTRNLVVRDAAERDAALAARAASGATSRTPE